MENGAISRNALRPSRSIKNWLEAKQNTDKAEGLWRVHDKLYDLINFIPRHPGGADWLRLTQGTDVTELFETHHISGKAEMLLNSFYVKEADEKRNYGLTFCDDGFYKSLKAKVAEQLPTLKTSNVYKNSNVRSESLRFNKKFQSFQIHRNCSTFNCSSRFR